MESFKSVAEKKSYVANVKAGKFLLKKGMNNNNLINSLRQPLETKIAFNNQERLEDLAGRIGSQIEADSTSLMKAFTDKQFLDENGFTEENVLSMFIQIPMTFSGTLLRKNSVIEWPKNTENFGLQKEKQKLRHRN